MARKRRLFAVQSPLGYHVFLERDRWRQIIRHKHPALTGHEKDVQNCVTSPTLVRESATDETVHMYYAPADGAHICVVVAPANENEYFVVTAYYTANIKKGKELWRS
jgi:hypothetical protein